MEHVERADLLPVALQGQGYRTVFAIDERRFSNIDESFGFDEVIGPKAGALDFVLQGINDNPLSNLLLQTPLGGYLFPYSYMNVASYTNYSSSAFVNHIISSSRTSQPLFLAVHFESAHFPFKTRHAQARVERENGFLGKHLEALTVVDGQIASLLDGLKKNGVLDNALVILLSDHGEGLGEVEASVLRDGQPFSVRGYGHGADVLSDHENRILLATVEFRDGKPVSKAGLNRQQVSLLDIRRTVENYVRDGKVDLQAGSPCIMVETGIRLDTTQDYRTLDETKVAAQAASYYEIDQQGRLRLREDRLPELLATKDIGWRCADRITWYEPAGNRYLAYRLDEHGLPTDQLQPEEDDIARIQAYRDRYLKK
ncbi:Sulfatase [Pseudomonas jinjuensis]|uniref:Sulfatase n=2 Tax=Pseudomonas jinjuensis TaxID=198616 RepID=A0A1H0MIT2_9PSED|nr:Sulfatase [Pseudomonas jinjuensis]